MDTNEVITNTLKVVNGAGFIAVPALAAWKGLDWYFTRDGKKTQMLFISVGGLLSSVLYSYLVWTEPSKELINTPILWWFVLSLGSVAAYYGLYTYYDGKADKKSGAKAGKNISPPWLLPLALVSYSCLLCAVGGFCAAALARHSYLIVAGTVYGDGEANPVVGAAVELQDSANIMIRDGHTDLHGRYLLTLRYTDGKDKSEFRKPEHILVKAEGFLEQNPDFDGHPDEHRDFRLHREPTATAVAQPPH